MLYSTIEAQINTLDISTISETRREILQQLIDFIQTKKDASLAINLNFICTHNSRRSHLSQIWAQTLAYFYNIKNVYCYSGGTEATALFPVVAETLKNTGFNIETLTDTDNPIYSIKYAENAHPVIGFSKTFDADFNPNAEFAAIMTCSSADAGCPFVLGSEKRIALTFEDPKTFDNTPQQLEKYNERSSQIATELKYVFSKLN